jgi:uncharacterized protein (TIGR03085 family)
MTRHALIERHAMCDTLELVGPDAPTLCPPWLTRDLAAHLALRERRPDAAIGTWLAPVSGHTQRVQDEYAARDWPALVDLVRTGPPAWWPAPLDERANLTELYIHHEDVLRAQPGWTARERSAGLESALWHGLKATGRLLFRRSPVGVVLVTPSHGRLQVRAATDLGTVVLRGEPGELVLLAANRRQVAQVEVSGPDEAVAAFHDAALGLL